MKKLCLTVLVAASTAAFAWEMGEPIVTYWGGPGYPGHPERLTERAAKQLKDGGFNVVWTSSPEELDVAARYGLRAICDLGARRFGIDDPAQAAALAGKVAQVKGHPALYLYHHFDEPSAGLFPGLVRERTWLREQDPAHATWVNLLPIYASNAQLDVGGEIVSAYREHVRLFDEIYRPDFLSYDHYQFNVGGDTGRYLLNLDIVRAAAEKRGVPFVNGVQSCTWKPGRLASPSSPRIPGPDELRYLVHTTLAYGAQGIYYYVYSFPRHAGAIAELDGTTGANYEALKSLNREFVALAREIRPYRFNGAYLQGVQAPGARPYGPEAVLRLSPETPMSELQAGQRFENTTLVSRFDADGAPARFLVVNLDYRTDRDVTVGSLRPLERFDPATGAWIALDGTSPLLKLVRGGGVLLRFAECPGNPSDCGRAKLGGFLGARMDACIERSVKASDVAKMTDVFRTQKETILWQSEFWGKWMHAAAPFSVYADDAELRRTVTESAKEMMGCQLPNGYLGNYAPEKQCGEGTWDVWGRKYTLLGLVHYYDLTGDRAALACCGRMVDHLMTQVGPGHRSLAKTGSHRGLASLSILEPLVLLWERTQDVRYRKAIDYVLSEMCDNPEGPELLRRSSRDVAARFADGGVRDSNSPAKAYEMMSCYQGLLEWCRVSGERKYLDACVRTARNIAATEINVLGSGSSLECWYGGKAKETRTAIGAMETCVTTTWMRFLESLFAATGDPFYADELERTLYNAYLGAMKRDGSGWLQYCPPNGSRGQGNLQCGMGTSCCIQNGPRGFLAALRALVVGRDDGVDVGLYAESSATVKAAGGEVTVTQRTDYPRSGKVRLAIGCRGTEAEWTLRLRIPRWCTADDRPAWREIRRAWKDGDTYELDLDMKPRTVAKDRHLAVFWGPVALARSGIFGDGETGEMLARPFGDGWCPLRLTPVDPGEALVAFAVPMPFGSFTGDKRRLPAGIRTVKMCDWASAGDLWRPDAPARVWLPVALDPSAPTVEPAAFCP